MSSKMMAWEKRVREHYVNIPAGARLGWHTLDEDRILGYGDMRKVKVGETLAAYDSPVLSDYSEGMIHLPTLCVWGMHAGIGIMDTVAPDMNDRWLCLVWVDGDLTDPQDSHTKFAGQRRHCLAMVSTFDINSWVKAYYKAQEQATFVRFDADNKEMARFVLISDDERTQQVYDAHHKIQDDLTQQYHRSIKRAEGNLMLKVVNLMISQDPYALMP